MDDGRPQKRRRRTGKRDDRTHPKHIESFPRNPDGTLLLPVNVGKGNNEVIICDIGNVIAEKRCSFNLKLFFLGHVVWDRDGYYNHRYIWPVGFKSKKILPSLRDITKKVAYVNEILDGGEAPIVS